MSTPILATKLFIPPLRSPNLVPRPQLIARLNQGLQRGRKLTLISAPAGFGKTTLIAEWGFRIAESDPYFEVRNPHLGWLSLDEGDNDPKRFLAYLIAALQRAAGLDNAAGEETAVGASALDMLQSPQTPPVSAVLTALINDIAALPGKIVLALDDFHAINSSAVEEVLAYLLEHLPPNLHLVIATRIDPHLPFARLRAQDQLTELRALDLRFSSAEAAEFLNRVMGLDLSAADVAALEKRTEGWIAGLQLAAISMRGQKDTAALVKSFTGSHRYVLDYLIEEVLEQQPADIQDFLLQTAVLDRLTGSLCDAVRFGENVRFEETPSNSSGIADGQATLELLDHANLFIIPLDEQRHWYRYHHLFADLLRQRLRQSDPALIPVLRQRASLWFEENDFLDEAIDQALLAGDSQRAAALIARVVDGAWDRGEHGKLRRWLESLPLEHVTSDPAFSLYLAWCLLADGELEEAQNAIQAAQGALDVLAQKQNQADGANLRALRGKSAATRAFAAFYRGDFPQLFHFARLALETLPEQELSWRSTATHLVGDAYDFQGDMVQAYPSRLEAVLASQAMGNSYVSLISHLKLAIIMRRRGMLQEAIAICEQQMERASAIGMAQTVLAGWALAIWGETLAETNDLASAREKAQKSADLLQSDGDLAMIGSSYLGLIRIMFSCADFATAQAFIDKIESWDREYDMPPWITNLAACWQARLWLAQGDDALLSAWVSEQEPDAAENITYVRETTQVEIARYLAARGQLEKAKSILDRLLGPAITYGRTWRVIEIQILQALIHQAADDTDRALAALEQALITAEPGGFMRIFVDEGPPMAQLLYEANTHGLYPAYTAALLAAFPTSYSALRIPHSEFVEPLSERELEVLHLIAQGLSNSQIAARLYLSLHTIKAHTRNIYAKLDVHNRTQAVARARTLQLLEPN
jgi:LuxR family maltose regulon positive regulatory protein